MATTLVSTIKKLSSNARKIKIDGKKKTDKRQRGDLAEDLALAFLEKNGFKLIQRNFNCKLGELDLIMQDQDYLVFVEVRHRKSNQFGGALESITVSKQNKLRRAAEVYLQSIKNHDSPCRFDILCLTGCLSKPDFQWIKDAF